MQLAETRTAWFRVDVGPGTGHVATAAFGRRGLGPHADDPQDQMLRERQDGLDVELVEAAVVQGDAGQRFVFGKLVGLANRRQVRAARMI